MANHTHAHKISSGLYSLELDFLCRLSLYGSMFRNNPCRGTPWGYLELG
jgi:hypothetical protein